MIRAGKPALAKALTKPSSSSTGSIRSPSVRPVTKVGLGYRLLTRKMALSGRCASRVRTVPPVHTELVARTRTKNPGCLAYRLANHRRFCQWRGAVRSPPSFANRMRPVPVSKALTSQRSGAADCAVYLGLAKTPWQQVITATAIHRVHLGEWFAGTPTARTRCSRFAALQATG
jgi:hypothetical protein